MKHLKTINKHRREHRVRRQIISENVLPRLSVYRSNRNLSVQVIDDVKGVTIAAAHSREIKAKTRQAAAEKLGEVIAQKAIDKKVTKVVFDRGSYRYHGLVKAVADGARKGGLTF